ncbi:MAG: hypothetical protein HWN67_05090 [Candidatus Helarchaeota archaeon]|nr:hypothetical protein [Candidatus Helarchaeota archaeon]
MKIIVKRIIEQSNDRVLIWFETDFGSGAAEWDGETPKIGSKYFIEFGINDKFVWGENIRKSIEEKPLIDYKDKNLMIQGKVDQIYDDGVIVISLSPSNSIMLDLENTNFIKSGDFIEIIANKVKLFNSNI